MDYIKQVPSQVHAGDEHFKFRAITAQQGPLQKDDLHHKGSKYNVLVEWEWEVTYELLGIISKDDPIECATYAKSNNLLDVPGWKHLRRYVKHPRYSPKPQGNPG